MLIPHWPIYTGPNKDFEHTIERVKHILQKLGNPQMKMKNIIHITGTKGKGSTALYISNILRTSGYKVNTYTSPHIYECNERILLDGKKITDNELYEATEAVRLICEEGKNKENPIEPAMFEALTCSAFYVMAKNEADFNVIEVGMGARMDATNVFDDNPPIACVFTPIHLDHTKFLGTKIEDVAYNKSFLIKSGVKNVILSSQAKEAKAVLIKKGIECGLPRNKIICYGDDYEVFKGIVDNNIDDIDIDKNELQTQPRFNEDGDEIQSQKPFFESQLFDTCFPFHEPNMVGDYQLVNAGCAIATCLACQQDGLIDNLSIDTINEGIAKTINIVRMQQITEGKLFNLLPKGSIFYVDGAHNQLAAHALATFINEFKQKEAQKNTMDEYQDYKIVVAVARTKGVNNEAFLQEFFDEQNKSIIDLLICTRANLESIPEPPEIIANACKKLELNYSIAYDITQVVQQACAFAKKQKLLLICTGSLYVARDIHFANNAN